MCQLPVSRPVMTKTATESSTCVMAARTSPTNGIVVTLDYFIQIHSD